MADVIQLRAEPAPPAAVESWEPGDVVRDAHDPTTPDIWIYDPREDEGEFAWVRLLAETADSESHVGDRMLRSELPPTLSLLVRDGQSVVRQTAMALMDEHAEATRRVDVALRGEDAPKGGQVELLAGIDELVYAVRSGTAGAVAALKVENAELPADVEGAPV